MSAADDTSPKVSDLSAEEMMQMFTDKVSEELSPSLSSKGCVESPYGSEVGR